LVHFSSLRTRAQSFLRAASALGGVARETISVLREQGLGYRYTDFLRDYREHLGVPDKLRRIKFTRNDYILSSNVHSEIPQFMTFNFKYDVTFRVRSLSTGEEKYITTSVGNDLSMNKSSIFSEAEMSLEDSFAESGLVILDERVSGAWHQMGESY